MTTTRALAVSAYLAAVASPAAADWRSVADQLHAALPATRGASKPLEARGTSAPAWFADWKLGKVYSLDSLDVTFADGVKVRVNLAKAPNKAPRVAASCRIAVAFYRERTKRDSVPAFASLVAASDGQEFDAVACSALTADLRRTAYVAPVLRPAVTSEAVARMERELERRRAGLATSEAMPARIAAHVIPLCLSWDARGRAEAELRAMKESAGMAEAWRAAIAAGEAELATMRAALAAPEPVAVPCEPIASEPAAIEPEPASEPLAAVEAGPADHIAPLAICPAVGMPCTADCGFRSTCTLPHPVVEMDSADPVEAIEAEPLPALCASDDGADDWHADESTHPVIALCLSDKARAALFDRLQDGTFAATDRTAKGGAWRLTVADAEECAGLASVRFVGLPRKPYTRRAATPAVTIPLPPEAIRTVPAAAFIPGASITGPVTYHAAPAL
jgi:hypothetical protein